ncbi:Hypothetical protein A7982_04459 [Minicystis rosea]|nr:Hypothetical protein A7982_04459 [Minicystis rosea]
MVSSGSMSKKPRDEHELARLYELLSAPAGAPSFGSLESPSALPTEPQPAFFAPQGTSTRGLTEGDLPLLDPEGIEALEQLLADHPEEILARARIALDGSITEAELAERLRRARRAVSAPREAQALIIAQRALESVAEQLPPDFEFEGMDLAAIPIDPGNTKFEEAADALGWLVNTGRFVFGFSPGPKQDFRWHDAPGVQSSFVYPLRGQTAGSALSIALFADFGTGLYHSRYIGKQLERRRFPYAIHLGDVYYAGREAEFRDNFKAQLDPLLPDTRLFTMNSNHEMFSRGIPYFRYIEERRQKHPDLQEQEGSYFCLRGETLQIVAIDTDYFGYRRLRDPALLAWLEAQLAFGRAHGLTNVLLSGDEPYEYGSTGQTDLLDDLRRLLVDRALVDLWLWGNTHYCALFDQAPGLPFVGSCIGHGGFPYGRQKPNRASPAPVRFLETKARFPEWTGLRQDRGNNGYCTLDIRADGNLRLTYVDWMAHERAIADLSREADGRLSLANVDVL